MASASRSQGPTEVDDNLQMTELVSSDDFMESQAEQEEIVLSRLPATGAGGVAAVRSAAIAFMCRVSQAMRIEQSWQEVAALYDRLGINGTSTADLIKLPAMCCACLGLLCKMDMEYETLVEAAEFLAQGAAEFSAQLRSMGYWMVPTISPANIIAEELNVLKRLDWRLCLPAMDRWLEIFRLRLGTRFQRLKLNGAQVLLHSIHEWGLQCADELVSALPLSSSVPPRFAAAGLLAIALLRAGRLPVEELRPRDISSAHWAQWLAEGALAGTQKVQPEVSQAILDVVLGVVGLDVAELRACCDLMVSVLSSLQTAEADTRVQAPIVDLTGLSDHTMYGPAPAVDACVQQQLKAVPMVAWKFVNDVHAFDAQPLMSRSATTCSTAASRSRCASVCSTGSCGYPWLDDYL